LHKQRTREENKRRDDNTIMDPELITATKPEGEQNA